MAEHLRTAPAIRAGSPAQRRSWQWCMHVGEGPPPLTPWSGAGEGWISDLGSMPCRTRPPRLRPLGGSNSLLRHAERASVSPVPQIPQQEGSSAWGWARGATEGRVCCVGRSGGSLSSAQQQTLGEPRPGLAGRWGQGACLSLCGGTTPEASRPSGTTRAPVWVGSAATGLGLGGPCMQTLFPGLSLAPPFSRLQSTHSRWPDSSQLKFS